MEAPSGPDVHKQKAWDSPQVKAAFSVLLDAAIPRDKGRLLAVQRRESGAWLTAPPVASLGLRLEDETVRIGVGLRLGVPICSTHKCTQCGDQVDVYAGFYPVGGGGGGGEASTPNSLASTPKKIPTAMQITME